MAMSEIDSFIFKFKHLWKSGRSASLSLKSDAGKAQVTLHVDLDDAQLLPVQHPVRSGNGPARQRRRIRRAAEREAAEAAKPSKTTDENSVEADKEIIHENEKPNTGKASEKDAEENSSANYELKICAAKNCTDDDIIECFGINFKEALKEVGVTDERSNFEISKVPEKHVFKKFGDSYSNIQIYKVKVKNIKEATELVEGFDEKSKAKNWDDLAFTNWKRNNTNNSIDVKDVRRII